MALHDAVFILGAGASRPFTFPVGDELKARLLARNALPYGDAKSSFALDQFKKGFENSMAPSIDRFLQICEGTGRKDLVEIGMDLIAAELLPCERESLNKDRDWYGPLFTELTNCEQPAPRKLQVITFNYDRSLEWIFSLGLQSLYRCEPHVAGPKFAELVDIVHVYGQLGYLPNFPGAPEGRARIPYGQQEGHMDYTEIAGSFQIIGRPKTTDLHQRLVAAKFIVFVGFGFLDENMALLGLELLPAKHIIATGRGIKAGRRFTLKQKYGHHVWFFGVDDNDRGLAHSFFHEIDLYRQLSSPEAFKNFLNHPSKYGYSG